MVSATIVFHFANKIIPQWYSPLISISSHIPMLIIPWIWIRARRKNESKDIGWGKFNKKDKLSLLILCSWLIPLQILGNLDVIGKPIPQWYANGVFSICLQVFFQGIFVGFSEEMLMRPAIHRTLQQILPAHFRFFKWKCSNAMVITAILFGVLHFGNLGRQPIAINLLNVVYATIIGIIIGIYYEKTKSFIGSVIIHNFIDITGVLNVIIVSL